MYDVSERHSSDMRKEEFYYDSYGNTNKIHAIKWVPEGTPLCIVQIVHGMAEHVGRYDEFATFLTDRNIMVVGADHLGHGLSMGENPPGYFCEQQPDRVLVEDVRNLKNIIRKEYIDIPYIMFGHSMGSFITRNFIHTYSSEIDGVILSGTGMLPKALLTVMKALVNVLILAKGSRYKSAFADKIAFGGYRDRIDNPQTDYDWLSTDREKVKEYLQDSLCGFTFTLNGFKGLAGLLSGLYDREKIATIEKNFPMYFIYGDQDPVGDYGKSAYKSCCVYTDAGMNRVTCKVYPGKRHELLHEDIREKVMEEIYAWIYKEIMR